MCCPDGSFSLPHRIIPRKTPSVISTAPLHNIPGRLLSVQPVETVEELGRQIEAAFLVFEDHRSRPCRVYAERCLLPGPAAPAIVHCVGGGQTVRRDDLLDWASKGFSCVSFDWQVGTFPDHDPARKSVWPHGVVSQIHFIQDPSEAVLPVAVEAAGVCIDWLEDSGTIDPKGIGVAGISWGGYLSWLVAAYEPRVRAAVPVYGCGGQFDPRYPGGFSLHPDLAEWWCENWDPFNIPHRQRVPVCYLSCTNDFFGILPLANELLNRLIGPHRRGWLPNTNHCIGPRESALGLAWLRHFLLGGPDIPEEPVLEPNGDIEADQPADVTGTETWWTPELRTGDTGCWQEGSLPGHFAAAYARVHYRQGYTLSTPLLDNTTTPIHIPVESVPSLRIKDGLGWKWGMGSTQFHTNDVRVDEREDGQVLLHRDPGKDDDRPSFFFNQFAHPGWNTGAQQVACIPVATEPAEDLTEAHVTLTVKGTGTSSEVSASLPVSDGVLTVDPVKIPGFGPFHTWKSVLRLDVALKTRARTFRLRPITLE